MTPLLISYHVFERSVWSHVGVAQWAALESTSEHCYSVYSTPAYCMFSNSVSLPADEYHSKALVEAMQPVTSVLVQACLDCSGAASAFAT